MRLDLLSFTLASTFSLAWSAHIEIQARATAKCTPLNTTFSISNAGYTIVEPSTFEVTRDGVEMFLQKPNGKITTSSKNGTNDKLAEGATVNSTFNLLYGKVTWELSAPAVPGAITAAILISDSVDSYHEEIDVEILGSEPHSFQSNVFAPSAKDKEPLYGVLGGTAKIGGSITDFHRYSIDWNEKRIIWSVDDRPVRTLNKDETEYKGALHYPKHPMRIQFGIWDASSPQGTSEWAGGPIDWDNKDTHLHQIKAVVRKVIVECF